MKWPGRNHLGWLGYIWNRACDRLTDVAMFADLEQEEGSREFQNLLLMTTPLY